MEVGADWFTRDRMMALIHALVLLRRWPRERPHR